MRMMRQGQARAVDVDMDVDTANGIADAGIAKLPRETIRQVLSQAKNLLSVVTDQARLEAEILLAHVLEKPRSYLHAWPDTLLTQQQSKALAEYVLRRRNKEPIAYIINHREFWSLDLLVTADTLIPRPETELLVGKILELYGPGNEAGLSHEARSSDETRSSDKARLNDDAELRARPIKVADLGTGSGAIALALGHERPAWHIYAADISENALAIAKKNAQRLALKNISFHLGSWCSALPCNGFDVIVSNPPYISEVEWEAYAQGLAFEPREALVSGLDGLDAIRTICHSAKHYLKPEGYLLVEHGFLQGAAVRKIFAASGYSQIHSLRDVSGQERVTMAQAIPDEGDFFLVP
jgi:release factor glutamine methyltransferase